MAVRCVGRKVEQAALFDAERLGRPLPSVGEQKDIRYFGTHRAVGPERTRNDGNGFLVDQPVRRLRVRLRLLLRALRAPLGARPPRDGESRARRHAVRARRRCRPGSPSSGASSSSRTPPTCCAKRSATARRSTSRCSQGETIVIGTATDPFQPAERRFRITRSVLEVLAEHPGLSICIITKSPLVTRDIDVLRRINRISSLSVHLSLISLDRDLARRLEPRAPTPEARLRALARLRANGYRDWHQRDAGAAGDHRPSRRSSSGWCRLSPSDGASYVNACALRLRSSARARYLPFIEQEFPHLAKRYRATYAYDHKVSETYSRSARRDDARAVREARRGVRLLSGAAKRTDAIEEQVRRGGAVGALARRAESARLLR